MSTEENSIYIPGGRTGVLLIHGLCGTPLQVRYVARGLAQAGYTVHCPQLAGHCDTFDALRATNWVDWYASCEAAFKSLRAECDNVIVAGLSGGSLLALNLTAEHPDEILGTAVLSPPLKLDGWAIPWYAKFFELIRHRWFADLFRFPEREPYGLKDIRIRRLAIEAMQKGDTKRAGQAMIPGALMMELRWLSKAVRGRLASIVKPVLIVHPREDDRASLKNVAYLQQHLGGRVETLVLHNSYHIATMDFQKDEVIARVTQFADDLTATLPAEQDILRLRVQAAE